MAGVQGFEPRYYGPEPHVLPLDDTPELRMAEYSHRLDEGQADLSALLRYRV